MQHGVLTDVSSLILGRYCSSDDGHTRAEQMRNGIPAARELASEPLLQNYSVVDTHMHNYVSQLALDSPCVCTARARMSTERVRYSTPCLPRANLTVRFLPQERLLPVHQQGVARDAGGDP